MPYGLISEEEEKERVDRALGYLRKKYGDKFSLKVERKKPEEIGDIIYLPLGTEEGESFKEKVKDVAEFHLSYSYEVPAVILITPEGEFLLDGHARVISAYMHGFEWPFFVIGSKVNIEVPEGGVKVRELKIYAKKESLKKFHDII